jgi:hypothetical protein
MKPFKIRTQSKAGYVTNSRPCQWAILYLDDKEEQVSDNGPKIEIDGTKDKVVLNIHTDKDWISIPIDELILFLRMKDEQLANLFIHFKHLKYGTD